MRDKIVDLVTYIITGAGVVSFFLLCVGFISLTAFVITEFPLVVPAAIGVLAITAFIGWLVHLVFPL